ncbi:MAG TPA: 2-oxoglutarate dehydrogenase complex dihydrolipoyllysine-residue succinyltransferase [Pirellulaceae bacterium]|jgi:2-oxoglutarate dehydrogenase E2 component (dihydrolipoamide succinyltransferase)
MPRDVEIPSLGESVSEAVVARWIKNEGDRVKVDEPLCELESDKATVDLPAPESGVLHQLKKAGETAHIGEVIARIDTAESDGELRETAHPSAEKPASPTPAAAKDTPKATRPKQRQDHAEEVKSPKKIAPPPDQPQETPAQPPQAEPPIRKKEDTSANETPPVASPKPAGRAAEPGTRRVPMSKIRRSIAERLVRVQQTTAMLTTFNEVDMTSVQELRRKNQEQFLKTHGVSLGLMSFFARATVLALKHFEALNARIEDNDIVYSEHVHLGIAVSTERGLVVPILHHAEQMSFATIEQEIKRTAAAARDGKLSINDLSGGTFTITNGGVFGSLLSTPILNPPQSGILGTHAIQERPIAVKGAVQIRPMMYVALTYDHRLIDGSDAVSFLMHLKQLLEDPLQMILEI